MILSFDPNPSSHYQDGYWHACTDDRDWDADGPDPLTAVVNLTLVLEEAIRAEATKH